MKRIFVFGNPLIKEDCAAVKLLPALRKEFPDFDFRVCEPDELPLGEEVCIIDTAKNISKPVLLKSIDGIIAEPTLSAHGLDLSLTLKLMKKAGLLKGLMIFCVPEKPCAKEVIALLRKHLSPI